MTSATGLDISASDLPPDLPTPPRYGSASLPDLLPSVLAGMGVPGENPTLALPPASRVVVLLIDGLGAEQLAAAEDAPFLTAALRRRRDPRRGFPGDHAGQPDSLGCGCRPVCTA